MLSRRSSAVSILNGRPGSFCVFPGLKGRTSQIHFLLIVTYARGPLTVHVGLAAHVHDRIEQESHRRLTSWKEILRNKH